MSEIIAQIGNQNDVELADENGRLVSPTPLTQTSAAQLARELLACAMALSAPQPPLPKTIIGYAELPVDVWTTRTSPHSGHLILVLTLLSG
ncbi:MAG TPA: hypothetical protein VHO91_00600, partial [Rhodopila sp.]|nr:hypothetical protein [Rhodopila sp.]